MRLPTPRQAGFTVIELLVSLIIAALLLTAMAGLASRAVEADSVAGERSATLRDARFAMNRMTDATRGTGRLLLPLDDNPNTNWRENVREQTVPASPPEGSSTLATAVLAVTLDPTLDINDDKVFDADNDKDGRIDEDIDDDATDDGVAGIVGIDDDGDGTADEVDITEFKKDDDEDGFFDEDPVDGVDNDGDGSVDEDGPKDQNDDSAPGLAGVDDDGDGSTDEGQKADDDEDGRLDEDGLDPVVFFLSGSTLLERRPNLNPFDGNDYTEYPIADNVTRFRVERLPGTGKRAVLVEITLELTPPGGEPVSVNVVVRAGDGS